MFSNPWFYAALVAIVIIVVLASIAIKLLTQLKQQTIVQEQAKLERETSLKIHDKKVLDSIIIIVRAMKEEQCDIAEGCWRLSVLLDSLKLSSDLETQFPSVFKLYNGIKHMPILEARKKLAKKERMKLDFERMKLEAELAPEVKKDIEQLHEYAIERCTLLAPNVAS